MANSQAITPEIIISSIDKELSNLESHQTKSGWKRNAVFIALATVLWKLVEIAAFSEGTLNLKNIFLTFLMCSFTYEFIKVLVSLINYDMPVSENANRLVMARRILGGNRLTLVTFIVYWTILALVVFNYCNFDTLANIVVYSYLIIPIFFSIMIFFLSYFDLPLLNPLSVTSKALLVMITLSIVSFYAVGSVYTELTAIVGLSTKQVQLAMLMSSIPHLLTMLAELNSRSFIEHTLKDIRNDIVFGRITVEDSINQYEIAIKGIRAADAIQKEIDQVLSSYEDMLKFSHNINQENKDILVLLDELESKDLGNEKSVESLGEIRDRQLAILNDMDLFNGYIDSVNRCIDRLQSKISWVMAINKDFKQDLETSLSVMRVTLKNKKELGESLVIERKALRDEIDDKIVNLQESNFNS